MNKNVLGVIIAVVGVAVLAGLAYFGFKMLFGGTTANVNYLFDEFAAGNYEAAYDSTASDFQLGTTYEDFVDVGKYWQMDTVVDTKWSSINITGDLGAVKGTVEHKDGSKTAAHVDIIKEQDEWKVLTVLFGEAAANPSGYYDSLNEEVEEPTEKIESPGEDSEGGDEEVAEEVVE